MTSSISELRRKGIVFDAAEAVAIVQQLITHCVVDAEPVVAPFGPPSCDNVYLKDDGAVECRGCGSTPAVSEVGIFLDSLLDGGIGRVPGGLRYTIARTLLNVDVPPFDSLDDLSRDLARHERGDRAATVRGVLARARGEVAIRGLMAVERRRDRAATSTTELRRALREAEARLYEHQPRVLPMPIDVAPVQPKGRTLSAAAACLAAGLALIAAGELMHRRQPPIVLQPAAPTVAELPAPAQPIAEPGAGIIVVHDTALRLDRAPRTAVHRVAVRRIAAHPAATAIRPRPASQHQSRSVLDRLKLGWLRSAFSVHSDL
jgi:hypothetical protein